jgi:hypothetical protein
VRAAHPELDAANVINRVIATARDAGSPGADAIYGFGLLDARAAVTANVRRVTANPMGDLEEWITIYRRADPTPAPVVTAPPLPTPAPVVAGPSNPLGTLLPTVALLRNVGIPVAIVALFLGVGVWLGVTVLRQFKTSRKTR